MFSITPPKKIVKGLYMCSNKYFIDELIPLFQDHESYGGVIVTGDGFSLYQVNDYECKQLFSDAVTQMNNHNKGGQSAPRFRRLRENKRDRIVDYIAEQVYNTFWNKESGRSKVVGIIVAGSGDLKNEVMKSDVFKKHFASLVISVQSVNGNTSMSDVYKAAKESIDRRGAQSEEKALEEIRTLQTLSPELLVYGIAEVTKAVKEKLVKKVVCTVSALKRVTEGEEIGDVTLIHKYSKEMERDYDGIVGVLWLPIEQSSWLPSVLFLPPDAEGKNDFDASGLQWDASEFL